LTAIVCGRERVEDLGEMDLGAARPEDHRDAHLEEVQVEVDDLREEVLVRRLRQVQLESEEGHPDLVRGLASSSTESDSDPTMIRHRSCRRMVCWLIRSVRSGISMNPYWMIAQRTFGWGCLIASRSPASERAEFIERNVQERQVLGDDHLVGDVRAGHERQVVAILHDGAAGEHEGPDVVDPEIAVGGPDLAPVGLQLPAEVDEPSELLVGIPGVRLPDMPAAPHPVGHHGEQGRRDDDRDVAALENFSALAPKKVRSIVNITPLASAVRIGASPRGSGRSRRSRST
jgi:hypothetical protein